ncbi:MAG: signal peptidase II [Anaerolineaceae bacterium]|jgi:signal peptidase II
MKNKARDLLMLFGIAGAVIALDQWTKWLVEQNIALGEEVYPIGFLAPFFRFTFWKNTGAAFGLFQNASQVLLVVSIVISLLLVWVYFKSLDEPVLFRISLSMMLGGAIGNIIDRVTQGFVTDFIAVGRFPVFNVADSAVTVGVGLMLLGLYLQERKQKPDPEEVEEIDEE